uniref:hypothetical protein n=1 Tax=Nocardia donostiensis TaxID=1538463 RepID=UPI001FE83EAF|nr:hypothetical protein [Nocardia donostiensis]
MIEIGLTVVDLDACERVAKHRFLVRPARSTVSAFCTELTGLTQAEVDTGIGFAEACRLLATEHQAGLRPWASWATTIATSSSDSAPTPAPNTPSVHSTRMPNSSFPRPTD